MAINLYKITGDELGELKKKQSVSKFAYKFLPEYCLRSDNNKIGNTEYYLQFIESGDEEYFLFDIEYIEQPLQEEISSAGIEEVLNFDFSFLKNLNFTTYENMHKTLPESNYIVFELEYVGNGEDWDFNIIPLGFLNESKILEKI